MPPHPPTHPNQKVLSRKTGKPARLGVTLPREVGFRDFWYRRSRRGKILVVVVVGGLSIVLSISACGSDDEAATTATPETTRAEGETRTAQEEPPPDEAQGGECLKVPEEVVRGIETGLTTSGQGRLRNAWMVKSADPEGYLISADIQASGLEGDGDIATWSRTGSDINSGLIFAVDGVAREFSEWGAGANEGSPAADLRDAFRSSPAFEQSRECVAR
jgi:hypothetical protein